MGKKKPPKTPGAKSSVDWTGYSKPDRILTDQQEAAICGGILRPLLDYAVSDPELRFDIRARKANLYHRGASLLRLSGTSAPFSAEYDAHYRVALSERADDTAETVLLATETETSALTTKLSEVRKAMDTWIDDAPRTERSWLQSIAAANAGANAWDDEYVIVDIEYAYAKRRFDFVAIRRVEGVTGPGAFANPQLVLGELKIAGQPLSGRSGLAQQAADFVDLAKAESGAHLQRVREEITRLIAQKRRLGLLPEDLDVRGFSESIPELLVLFAGVDIGGTQHDRGITELHDRLAARRYPTDSLRFAHLADEDNLALTPTGSMTYREFKAHRQRLRG